MDTKELISLIPYDDTDASEPHSEDEHSILDEDEDEYRIDHLYNSFKEVLSSELKKPVTEQNVWMCLILFFRNDVRNDKRAKLLYAHLRILLSLDKIDLDLFYEKFDERSPESKGSAIELEKAVFLFIYQLYRRFRFRIVKEAEDICEKSTIKHKDHFLPELFIQKVIEVNDIKIPESVKSRKEYQKYFRIDAFEEALKQEKTSRGYTDPKEIVNPEKGVKPPAFIPDPELRPDILKELGLNRPVSLMDTMFNGCILNEENKRILEKLDYIIYGGTMSAGSGRKRTVRNRKAQNIYAKC